MIMTPMQRAKKKAIQDKLDQKDARIKELEEENRKLKQMYATLALDHQMAKEIIEKKL